MPRLDAVKVSPDWRYIIFVGVLGHQSRVPLPEGIPENGDTIPREKLSNGDSYERSLNIWAVGGEEVDAGRATPLLTEDHLEALRQRCMEIAPKDVKAGSSIRVTGFRHLQVADPRRNDISEDEVQQLNSMPQGGSPPYRAAFSFECSIGHPAQIKLSRLAVLDFRMQARNITHRERDYLDKWNQEHPDIRASPLRYVALSKLFFVDATVPNAGSDDVQSQSCPRFVPSKEGHQLLFVAEGLRYRKNLTHIFPSRRLGLASFSPHAASAAGGMRLAVRAGWEPLSIDGATVEQARSATARRLTEDSEETGDKANRSNTPEAEKAPAHKRPSPSPRRDTLLSKSSRRDAPGEGGDPPERHGGKDMSSERRSAADDTEDHKESDSHDYGVKQIDGEAVLLDVSAHGLPFAPVHGCPEFVPSLYTSETLTETISHAWDSQEKRAQEHLKKIYLGDTFVFESDPKSASVIGVDAQVLAISLPVDGKPGGVGRVNLLYDVDAFGPKSRLRLNGCQPIRAAGREGHMSLGRLQADAVDMFNIHTEQNGYAAWLACLTADQRVAIVESPKREHWINMSMPYPEYTGTSFQDVWCPDGREDGCFEVWSNPNPNR
jgi:hypothetical protein